jgi:hypothetical protein
LPHVPLERLLAERYQPGEWALIFELANGVGYSANGHIDAAAFNCWPSKGHHRIAFEVKRTRNDFLRELKTPKKREWVEENFHQCYFVTPHNLVKPGELPEGWGLLYATKKVDKLRQVKQAVHHKVSPLPEVLALAAIRACANMAARAQGGYEFEGQTVTKGDLERIVQEKCRRRIEYADTVVEEAAGHAKALEAERVALQEPFRELGLAQHRYGFRPDPNKPLIITRQDVKDMLHGMERRFRARVIEELFGPIKNVHDATAHLLRLAGEKHADDLPPSQRRLFPRP